MAANLDSVGTLQTANMAEQMNGGGESRHEQISNTRVRGMDILRDPLINKVMQRNSTMLSVLRLVAGLTWTRLWPVTVRPAGGVNVNSSLRRSFDPAFVPCELGSIILSFLC